MILKCDIKVQFSFFQLLKNQLSPQISLVTSNAVLLSHFSRVRLCVTLKTAAHQAPLFLEFSRQEYWSGLPFPSPQLHLTTFSQSSIPSKIPYYIYLLFLFRLLLLLFSMTLTVLRSISQIFYMMVQYQNFSTVFLGTNLSLQITGRSTVEVNLHFHHSISVLLAI